MERGYVFGIPIDLVTKEDLVASILSAVDENRKMVINNVNVHAMNIAYNDTNYKKILNNSDLVFCDGFGVKWGARILGVKVPERMTPPDWIDYFCARLNERGYSIFALGDEDGIAARFARTLRANHPGINVAGSYHGFFSREGEENKKVIDLINRSKAQVLLIGMGMPLQEKWVSDTVQALNCNVFIAVGALYRWYTGIDKRAPRWMSDHGLEWFFRFITQPRLTWRRYLIGNPLFVFRIFREKLRTMLRSK